MSVRPRRALLGLATVVAALAAVPAAAAADTLALTPSSTQAGGNPSITSSIVFVPLAGDAVKTAVISVPPGLWANLTANPVCITGTPQLAPACQIGTGSITVNVLSMPIPTTLFLVPAQASTDYAGIEIVPPASSGLANQYVGTSLRSKPNVGVNLTTTFPDTRTMSEAITGVSMTLNATLNGQPFTRLPTNCGPATTTLSDTYYGATPAGSASSAFTPTGCSSLPYAPKLTAAITTAGSGGGAALTLGITQAATESANKSIVLQLPKSVSPNASVDLPCLAGAGCTIGTATATSPLVPSVALANGTVTLAGPATTPTITVSFPAPFAVSLAGTVSLTSNSVTFANVPDLPLTSLTLNVTGPNGQKAFTTTCAASSVVGNFTAQGGQTATSTAPITFTGCPPTTSGSTGGLATGHPKLKFKATKSAGGANVSSVAIGLPNGLKFSRSAFTTKRTCTTKKGKKHCTSTTLIKGLSVSGGAAKTVALKAGKLVITLKKAVGSVSITTSGPLVTETKALQTKVKKHKTKTLKFTLKIIDTQHNSSTSTLSLNAH